MLPGEAPMGNAIQPPTEKPLEAPHGNTIEAAANALQTDHKCSESQARTGLKDVVPTSTNNLATANLAPPLPGTDLGAGAAHGATDLAEAGVPMETGTTTSVASSIEPEPENPAVSAVRYEQDRTTSSASITAIRHGHEGHHPSKLGASDLTDSTIHEKPFTEATAAATVAATAATAPAAAAAIGENNDIVSGEDHHEVAKLIIANADEAEGNSVPVDTQERDKLPEPAVETPAGEDSPALTDQKKTVDSSPAQANSTTAEGEKGVPLVAAVPATPEKKAQELNYPDTVSPKTSAVSDTPRTPTSAVKNESSGQGHQRTGSNASTGSKDASGKKKVGFMKKLKEKMKH